MLEKVEDLLKSGNYIIPKLLINNFRDINLSAQQTLLLIYLINNDKLFNPKKISEDLSWSLNEILEEINDLTSKGLLTIDLVKNNNIHEEYINLDSFYSKLAFLIVNDKPKTVDNKNLFDSFHMEPRFLIKLPSNTFFNCLIRFNHSGTQIIDISVDSHTKFME